MSSRVLCVNCGLCVNRVRRHSVSEQDTRVISFIAEKISPRVIENSDNICQACLDAVKMRVNQIIHNGISSNDNQLPGNNSQCQVVGHSKVCLMCGCSILRRRSDLILRNNPSELQQMIITSIMNSIKSQELTTNARVCHSCWLKAKRNALRMKAEQTENVSVDFPPTHMVEATEVEEHDVETPNLHPAMEQSEMADNVKPEKGPHEADIVLSNPSVSSISSSNCFPAAPLVATENVPAKSTITLSNYRRAPNTAAQCVFNHCTNRDLHRVSDALRTKIIIDHHFYLPLHIRVCSHHLLNNSWDTLYNSENSSAVFTEKQVEHVFSFIEQNKTSSIDFNDPLSIDDHLFQYWLGLTKEKFNSLLMEVPEIQMMHRGVIGLVAHLIKLRNGDSDDRIASLLGISRRSLERYLNNVREKLM